MEARTHSPRAALCQAFVFFPELRCLLLGQPLPENANPRVHEMVRPGDHELAALITDDEIQEAANAEARYFADVFPAGI